VWLASTSKRNAGGKIIGTARWGLGAMNAASRLLDDALHGIGEDERQREFRMPVTLCRHRALTDAEIAGLPKWWHDAPALDVAGPPMEVRWSKGIRESLSLQPCENPTRLPIAADVYLIQSCGECRTCRASGAA
jgi:hypothetical protein